MFLLRRDASKNREMFPPLNLMVDHSTYILSLYLSTICRYHESNSKISLSVPIGLKASQSWWRQRWVLLPPQRLPAVIPLLLLAVPHCPTVCHIPSCYLSRLTSSSLFISQAQNQFLLHSVLSLALWHWNRWCTDFYQLLPPFPCEGSKAISQNIWLAFYLVIWTIQLGSFNIFFSLVNTEVITGSGVNLFNLIRSIILITHLLNYLQSEGVLLRHPKRRRRWMRSSGLSERWCLWRMLKMSQWERWVH